MAAVSELVDQNDTKPDRNSESEVTNEDSSDNTIIGTISGNNVSSNRHELNNSTHQKSAGKNLDSVGKLFYRLRQFIIFIFPYIHFNWTQFIISLLFSDQIDQIPRTQNTRTQKMRQRQVAVQSRKPVPAKKMQLKKYDIVEQHY